jgi:hypothetical protein
MRTDGEAVRNFAQNRCARSRLHVMHRSVTSVSDFADEMYRYISWHAIWSGGDASSLGDLGNERYPR